MISIFKSFVFWVTLPALLIAAYGWWTYGGTMFFVPSLADILDKLVTVWGGDRLLADLLPSVTRLVAGLAIAIFLGVGLGLMLGSVRWVRYLTEPLLELFRALPPPVLIPVLMLLVGVGDSMKVLVIVVGSIWPVLLNTTEGVRAVDPVLGECAQSYRIRGLARVWHLTLPSASPQIMAGIRQSLSIGLILMVVSEMFASSAGLGYAIIQFQRTFSIAKMWSGIIVLGLIGIAMAIIFQMVERRVLAWYFGLKQTEGGG